MREIGKAVGLSSSSSTHAQLRALTERGYLRRDPLRPRALSLTRNGGHFPAIPVVGRIAAGEPILAEEHVEETLQLPPDLTGPGEHFALKVKGESMTGAGILPGDYVIIRSQTTAEDGQIVAALLDDEATLKRFFRDRDAVRLEPENPSMSAIHAAQVNILGVVVSLLRRF